MKQKVLILLLATAMMLAGFIPKEQSLAIEPQTTQQLTTSESQRKLSNSSITSGGKEQEFTPETFLEPVMIVSRTSQELIATSVLYSPPEETQEYKESPPAEQSEILHEDDLDTTIQESIPSTEPEYPEPDDYEVRVFATMMYYEGDVFVSYDGMVALGSVVINRMNDPVWNETSASGHVYRENQFSVIHKPEFEPKVLSIREDAANGDARAQMALDVATGLLNGATETNLPAEVQYFNMDSAGHTWGNRVYYTTIDNTAFFK